MDYSYDKSITILSVPEERMQNVQPGTVYNDHLVYVGPVYRYYMQRLGMHPIGYSACATYYRLHSDKYFAYLSRSQWPTAMYMSIQQILDTHCYPEIASDRIITDQPVNMLNCIRFVNLDKHYEYPIIDNHIHNLLYFSSNYHKGMMCMESLDSKLLAIIYFEPTGACIIKYEIPVPGVIIETILHDTDPVEFVKSHINQRWTGYTLNNPMYHPMFYLGFFNRLHPDYRGIIITQRY